MTLTANIKWYINWEEWGAIKQSVIDQCWWYKPWSNNLLFLSWEWYREEFDINQLTSEDMKETISDFIYKRTSSAYTKDSSNAIQTINCHLWKTNRSYQSPWIQCPMPWDDQGNLSTVKLSELIDLIELQEWDKYSIVIFSYNYNAEQEDESVNIYVINDIYNSSDKDIWIMDNELLNLLKERRDTESVVILVN